LLASKQRWAGSGLLMPLTSGPMGGHAALPNQLGLPAR